MKYTESSKCFIILLLFEIVTLCAFAADAIGSGDGNILKRSQEDTCHACHKTDQNTPSPGESGYDQEYWNNAIKVHSSDIIGACDSEHSTYQTKKACVDHDGTWTPGKWTADCGVEGSVCGWGTAGGQYGAFLCTTCHTAHDTKNIYLIRETITAPIGNFAWGTTNSVGVDFRKLSGSTGDLGLMGDDTSDHSTSFRICEVCHSKNKYHDFNTADETDKTHHNAEDCKDCHRHQGGFKPGCDGCHGYPPQDNTIGPPGLARPATGSNTAGAHVFHATSGGMNYECAYCHSGSVGRPSPPHKDGIITMAFKNIFQLVIGGSYDGQTTANYESGDSGTTVSNNGGKTCSIYCHGSTMPANGGKVTSPVWSAAAGSYSCANTPDGACHGARALNAPNLGSHTWHTSSGGYAFECALCHNSTGNSPTGTHVNASVQWAFSANKRTLGATYNNSNSGATNTPAPSASYSSCSSLYCHSNASPIPNTTNPAKNELNVYKTVKWGGTDSEAECVAKGGTWVADRHICTNMMKCYSCHKGRSSNDKLPIVQEDDNTYENCQREGGVWDTYCVTESNVCVAPYSWDSQLNVCRAGSGTLDKNTCEGSPLNGRWVTVCVSVTDHQTPLLTMNSNGHERLVSPKWIRKYPCTYCHNATISQDFTINKTNHVNGERNVAVSSAAPVDWTLQAMGMTYKYDNDPTSPTYRSCINLYCHSDGTKKPEQTRPFAWTEGGTQCNSCHGHPTGSCSSCHEVAENQTATPICSGISQNTCTTAGGTWYNGVTCTNLNPPETFETKCKSLQGWPSTTQPTICATDPDHLDNPITQTLCESWDGIWMGLLCNGLSSATCANLGGQSGWPPGKEWMSAAPMYPSEGAASDRANSHPRHVQSGFTCNICHYLTIANGVCTDCHNEGAPSGGMGEVSHVNVDKHVNHSKNVDFKPELLSDAYNFTSKTCTNICHTGDAPVWGGSVGQAGAICKDCHLKSLPDKDFYGSFTYSDTDRPIINKGEWLSSGHGRQTSSGPYPYSGNPAAGFPDVDNSGSNPCAYCHDNKVNHADSSNPFRLKKHTQFKRRFEKECLYCHMQGLDRECVSCHNTGESLAPQLSAIYPTNSSNPKCTSSTAWPDGSLTGVPGCPDHRGYVDPNGNQLTSCITSGCHFIDPNFKTNLLADPDFENSGSGWTQTGTGISFDTSVYVNGKKSLKLNATGSMAGLSQTVSVTGYAQYVLSAYIKTDSSFTSGRALCDVTGAGVSAALASSTGDSRGWLYRVSDTITIPAGTSSVTINCYADNSPQGTAYFDFVQFGSSDMKLHNTGAGLWTEGQKLDIKNQYVWMGVCLKCHDDDSGGQCTMCHTPPANNPKKYDLGYDGGLGAAYFITANKAKASSDHFGYKHYNYFSGSGGWDQNGNSIGIWKGGKFCWDCHDPHGDTEAVCSNSPGTKCAQDSDCDSGGTCTGIGSTNNIFMIHRKVSTATDGKYGKPTSYGCNDGNQSHDTQAKCEAAGATWMTATAGVSFVQKTAGTDYAMSSPNTRFYGICNVCHTSGICTLPQYTDKNSCQSHSGGWTDLVEVKHYTNRSGDNHNDQRGGCSDAAYTDDPDGCRAAGYKWNLCTNCHNHKFTDSHASGNSCSLCHQGKPVPRHSGFGLPRDCTKCHIGIAKRTDIMGQMNGNGHHVQGKEVGVEVSNKHCYPCHWESTAIGLIDTRYHLGYNYKTHVSVKDNSTDLVIWGPGTRPVTYNTDPAQGTVSAATFLATVLNSFGTPAERSEVGKVTTHCLSCHSDQNSDAKPFSYCSKPALSSQDPVDCATNGGIWSTSPDGSLCLIETESVCSTQGGTWKSDCKVPRQYSWDQQSIGARYSQNCTKWSGGYNVGQLYTDQTTCEANGGTWAPKTTTWGKYVDTSHALILSMDETSWNGTTGEVKDISPNGNNGTAISGANTVAGGRFGRAGSFNGGNYISIPASTSLSITGPISVSAWVKFNSLGTTNQMILLGAGQYVLFVSASNQIVFRDNHGYGVATSAANLNTGVWYHVVGVFSGTVNTPVSTGNTKVYLNGVEQATTLSIAGNWSASSSVSALYVGWNGGTSYFNGLIDEVVIYKVALSGDQIQTLAKGLSRYIGCDSGVCSTAQKNLIKSYSAHGDAVDNYGGGWNMTTGIDGGLSPTRGGASAKNVQCFDCHSSHGSKLTGVTSSYTTSYGGLGVGQYGGNLKETVQGKGGYIMTYSAKQNPYQSSVNPYNSGAGQCFDCHETANGGVVSNPDGYPWGWQGTFGASASIIGYKDTPRFGPGTKASQQRYTYRASKNTIMGGHLKRSTDLEHSPDAQHQINGLCTPCHDPHGVSPTLGSNQQYAVPLLKGTWLTSPYKEDTAQNTVGYEPNATASKGFIWFNTNSTPYVYNDKRTFGATKQISEDETLFAGLCLNCHLKANLTDGNNTSGSWKSLNRVHTSVKGWASNQQTVEHFYTCSKCHQPHNSGLPRLMQTDCLDANHRGRVPSGGYAGYGGNSCGYDANTNCGAGTCSNVIGRPCGGSYGSCPSGGTCLGTGDNPPVIGNAYPSVIGNSYCSNTVYTSRDDCKSHGGRWYTDDEPGRSPSGGDSSSSGGFPRGFNDHRSWRVQCHPTTEGWPNNFWNSKTPW